MEILLFSSDEYVRHFFTEANKDFKFNLEFTDYKLNTDTVSLAQGYSIISCFIHDELNSSVLKTLNDFGVKLIALRSIGYTNLDVKTALKTNITFTYVPTYSPYSVAEHAVALILSLNRKTYQSYLRIRNQNFSLQNMIGSNLHDATVGIIGTGKIGSAFAGIMRGFGCKILAYDIVQNKKCLDLGAKYVSLEKLLSSSDIISLHCSLTPETYHLINAKTLKLMNKNVMLINTARGAIIDTIALIDTLKSGKIAGLGLDVYEKEQNLFSYDLSGKTINDEIFTQLQTFPNVLITAHMGYLTKQAYTDIANTTLKNIATFTTGTGKMYKIPLTDVSMLGHKDQL